jgi:hypothetical protein
MQQAPSRRSCPKGLKASWILVSFRLLFLTRKIAVQRSAGHPGEELALKPNEWRETYTLERSARIVQTMNVYAGSTMYDCKL